MSSSAAREEALRRDTAREQARAERERERERLRAEAAERVERKRREEQEAEAAARDEDERALAEEQAEEEAAREREREAAEAEYRRERERARIEAAAAQPETDDESAAEEPQPRAPAAPLPRRTLAAIGAAVLLMILGALGPWAKAVFVVDYGVDRNGLIVIAAAIVTAVLLVLHLRRGRDSWLPLVTAGTAAFSAALVAGDFRDLIDDPTVGPTWGIYMAFIGSILAVCVSMVLLVRRR